MDGVKEVVAAVITAGEQSLEVGCRWDEKVGVFGRTARQRVHIMGRDIAGCVVEGGVPEETGTP